MPEALRVGTNSALDREFLNAGLWPGADWSESRVGTNGIGTCIEERRPVIIHRDGHFLSRNIGLSCSGNLPSGRHSRSRTRCLLG